MSFIILLLIIFLIYACLAKYGSITKAAVMITIIFGMTAAFTAYGVWMFGRVEVFSLAGTEINLAAFIHVCIVWTGADMICAYRIVKNYRYYLEVNGGAGSSISAGQGQV